MHRLLFALFLFFPFSVHAAPDAAVRLADILGAQRTMQADFEQTVHGSNGVVTQSARGTMQVARPQLFRWEVRQPFEQLIIADGTQVWVHDPDLMQAVVRPFDRQLADTPALLFGGDARRIGERFVVTIIPEETDRSIRFELKPRADNALFESLRVTFIDNRLREMSLLDGLGQRTRIQFGNVSLNAAIPESRFRFEPPPGTDVIREGGD